MTSADETRRLLEHGEPAENPRAKSPSSARTGTLRLDGRPLYVRAEEAIRELIVREGLAPGDHLPAEVELARILGISRPTTREALRQLELDGLVRRVHGRGTIVALRSGEIVAGLEQLESLESLAARQGWRCGTEGIEIERSALTEADADALQREVGSAATRIRRVKTRDGERVALMESVVPEDALAHDEVVGEFDTSIIDLFRQRGAPAVHQAIAHVRAEPASHELAEALAIEPGAALLVLEEIFLAASGTTTCLNRNWFISGTMRLDLIRRLR